MSDKYDLMGCMTLIGKIIRQAISDASISEYNEYNKVIKQDAMDFLFADGMLERFVQKYHVQNDINVGYIRMMAKKIIAGELDLNSMDKEDEAGEETPYNKIPCNLIKVL